MSFTKELFYFNWCVPFLQCSKLSYKSKKDSVRSLLKFQVNNQFVLCWTRSICFGSFSFLLLFFDFPFKPIFVKIRFSLEHTKCQYFQILLKSDYYLWFFSLDLSFKEFFRSCNVLTLRIDRFGWDFRFLWVLLFSWFPFKLVSQWSGTLVHCNDIKFFHRKNLLGDNQLIWLIWLSLYDWMKREPTLWKRTKFCFISLRIIQCISFTTSQR